MILSLIVNVVIAVVTSIVVSKDFYNKEGKRDWKKGAVSMRFFTTLSNMFNALAACVLAIAEIVLLIKGGQLADLPYGIILLKYVATCAVTVTFLTVMAFLGPVFGYKAMLGGAGAWVHAAGPLLSVISFCFLEKVYAYGFSPAWMGILPTFVYGTFYLYRVVFQTEEKGGWPDFYAFNRSGKWPISYGAMMAGSVLVCIGITLLHNIGL